MVDHLQATKFSIGVLEVLAYISKRLGKAGPRLPCLRFKTDSIVLTRRGIMLFPECTFGETPVELPVQAGRLLYYMLEGGQLQGYESSPIEFRDLSIRDDKEFAIIRVILKLLLRKERKI